MVTAERFNQFLDEECEEFVTALESEVSKEEKIAAAKLFLLKVVILTEEETGESIHINL